MLGEFNVRNCLAVIIAADAWGVEQAAMKEAFATFQSVQRRMQVRGQVRGVTVIDDFAHHPTAVRETLQALRAKYAQGRLVAVFEPRSTSSRLAVFQQDYVRAFAPADYVVIASVFNPTTLTQYGALLDTAELTQEIAHANGKPAHNIAGADEIVRHLTPELRAGDTVIIMSNGGFGGVLEKLLGALPDREQ